MRFLIANYLVALFDLGVDVDFRSLFQILPNDTDDPERGRPAYAFKDDDRIPLIVSTHHSFEERYVRVPPVMLVRSPLDVLVSYYLHKSHHRGKQQGSLHDFVRDPRFGVSGLVTYYNSWATPIRDGRSVVLSYEGLRADVEKEIRRVWPILGLPDDEAALHAAVERSEFDRLRELESTTQIPGFDYDPSVPDARRVRRGKVGGWSDYMDEAEARYIRDRFRAELSVEAVAFLSPYWPEIFEDASP